MDRSVILNDLKTRALQAFKTFTRNWAEFREYAFDKADDLELWYRRYRGLTSGVEHEERFQGLDIKPRAKTGLLLQLEAVECGAAVLGMILEYHGRIEPLSELRRECGVSRDGSKASNMLKAARKYGLNCKGFKENLQSAMELQTPYVVFWNFNHFLVVEGFDLERGIVYINDPAHGHRKVTVDEFDESFTGVVLLFEPGAEFEKGGSKPSLVEAISRRLMHSHEAIKYCLLAGLILTIPGLIIPAYTQVFLDYVLGESRTDWLRPLVMAMGVTILFKGAAELLKYKFLRRLKIHLSVAMSSEFFWHLLKLPMGFYSQRYSGEIALRQELNDNMADILSGKLADTAINCIMMVFYAFLMMYYNFWLTMVGVFFALLNFVALSLVGQRRVDANIRLRQDFGKVAGDTIAALQSMETIKASGQESSFFTKWGGRYAKAANSLQELQIATQSLTVLPTLFSSLTTVTIYVLGGVSVIHGDMTIGTLVAFTALMNNFQDPIKDLVDLGSEIQELEGDLKRLDDVLMTDPDEEAVGVREDTDSPDDWPLQLAGQVTLKNIKFGYSPLEPPLFEDVNIEVLPGKRVAFVGGSGSGKTTLGHLVCGLYKPWEGEVLFDGHDRRVIPRAVMTSSFAVVSQEVSLFEGTVRDNLTLWDNTIPDDTLKRALEDAAVLDVVLALPGGIDGMLLEGGANLSGGQRQRLEIARALVQNPSILVFDEATSALDSETERIIDERLRLRGCTCILVAHRLSTIRDCNEIIVLDKGKIIERGTHTELWEAKGLYADLLKAGEGVEEADA
ncbi:MAG: NHLP family bacteriocin export ABC transporter peptidase/permease/ATPase subunit [Proteobacteria bacterium]|jgi:ATP-binding cassette subfamily C protein|nr:NHLP family bacteriocin export ABC transporter peptidase/permease/ATPase subunit [Pseudomonadota bacterium]